MRRTILKKQLAITMSIVFCSYVMIGMMTMLFFSQFWRSEKRELLTQNAANLSAQASGYSLEQGEVLSATQFAELSLVCRSISKVIGADIIITNASGQPVVSVFAGNGSRPE